MRSTRLVPLLLVLGLMAASCGGEGSIFEGSTTTAPPAEAADVLDAEALAAAEAIVADLGDDTALSAVGFALDRGYTAGQIAEGGRENTLQADGTITGVEPALPLWGIFSDLPPTSGSGGGGAPVAGSLLAYAGDQEQVDADSWKRGLATNFDALISGPAGSSLSAEDQDMAVVMIALILGLADMGYSADQIILGIAADEWALGWIPTTHWLCWHLRDAQGNIIRPARPAGGSFPDTEVCRPIIDEASTTSSSSTTSTSTTTTTMAPVGDADSIQDGVYVGNVAVTGEVSEGAIYEILGSEIRLDVTDQGIDAEVAFTQRVSVRSSSTRGPLCIATLDYVYRGQWPALETVGPPLPPVSQSIRLLEGPECGIVDPWDTTAEDYLLAGFAEERTITVVGSFADGGFEGVVTGTPLSVSATLGG